MAILTGTCTIGVTGTVANIGSAYTSFRIAYSGALQEADVLVIDTDARTVKLNGSNVRSNFSGDFWKLFTGTNEIRWSDDESSRSIEVVIAHEPRWL